MASMSAFSLLRYSKSIRRAVRNAELAVSRRNRKRNTIRARLKALVPAAVARSAPGRWLAKAVFGARTITRRGSGIAARRLVALLFRQRRQIRALMTKVISDRADIAETKNARRLILLSQRIINRKIPGVTRLMLNLVHFTIITMLTAQMTAGRQGNTLLLARVLNLTFRSDIRNRRLPTSYLYFQALFHCRQFHRIVREVPGEEKIGNHYLNHILGVSHLYSADPQRARYYLQRAIAIHPGSHPDHRMLGRAHLLLGQAREAAACFKRAVALAPATVMAHQNYAGRYDIQNYNPKKWELRRAGALMVYDNYGQLAEDFFLLGNFDMSFRCYQQMIDFQRRWKRMHPLPRRLVERLARSYRNFDPAKPVRLLPYEWVTQFGHIGLLDSYIKMARLGMYPDANYVLLAPKDKVVNPEYLAYWDDFFTIVRDAKLVDELFPYQRLLGDNFMAYPGERGRAEPWTRAAARAHFKWAREKREPLLKLSDKDRALGERALRKLGVPKGAWYVGLHVREGGYYGESFGGISTHRNSQIEDYLPAVKAITDRGGYVIRLGDKTMRPLDPVPGLIDYAMSDQKSPRMDIFLCASSRFVIGTTSGLTTACLSFGTPMALVNCISNDWQLWSGDTDFILKRVWDLRNKRFLPFSEAFSQPIQGYLINSLTMRRHGLEAIANTTEEIEEAVRYKLDLLEGVVKAPGPRNPVMARYRTAMADNRYMFGAARPALPWLERHPELSDVQLPTVVNGPGERLAVREMAFADAQVGF